MSEYLTYILWRQREHTLPHQLERQRVVEERLTQALAEKEQVRQESAKFSAKTGEESPERFVPVSEADLERVN